MQEPHMHTVYLTCVCEQLRHFCGVHQHFFAWRLFLGKIDIQECSLPHMHTKAIFQFVLWNIHNDDDKAYAGKIWKLLLCRFPFNNCANKHLVNTVALGGRSRDSSLLLANSWIKGSARDGRPVVSWICCLSALFRSAWIQSPLLMTTLTALTARQEVTKN